MPRWHTELVAERAAELLPDDGVAIDVCTGSRRGRGDIARRAGRALRVVGVDLDHNAVVNARANGVEAYEGDLFAPLPADLALADVVVGVVPTSRAARSRCCSATRSASRPRWPTTAGRRGSTSSSACSRTRRE